MDICFNQWRSLGCGLWIAYKAEELELNESKTTIHRIGHVVMWLTFYVTGESDIFVQ